MKKIILLIMAITPFFSFGQLNKVHQWANFAMYEKANKQLPPKKGMRVVFMGNSITQGWVEADPLFFEKNNFVGRGISGQTTPQMLVRFREDVVNVGADKVVILAGTNDIAENTGYIPLEMIVDNIASMCDIASQNHIQPIICSVLPAKEYPWRKDKRPDMLIPQLNQLLKAYASKKKIVYVDYFTPMANKENGLDKELAEDGVHPTLKGYKMMEQIILKALKK